MQYSQKVLDHFMHPHNVGKLDDANVTATEGSPACGDQVTFYLKINDFSSMIFCRIYSWIFTSDS